MCQNSFLEHSEQIERCLEHGMPEKIVKSVMYTLKKRAKQADKVIIETKEILKETETLTLTTLVPQTLTNELQNETITKQINETKPAAPQKQPKESSSSSASSASSSANSGVFNQNTSNLRIPKMCGRFRQMQQMQQTHNKIESFADQHKFIDENVKQQYIDVLSIGTAYTKLFFEHLMRQANQFKKSKIYSLLTQTTQPAHFIAICILSAVLLTIWPDLIDSTGTGTATSTDSATATAPQTKTGTDQAQRPKGTNTLVAIAYLGAFATHFGAQIWMTFVSGLSLYFSLPRHTFGQCQQILFPKYFAFNAILSIILLILFVKCFILTWSVAITVQFVTLVLNPVIELIVRLYIAPPMLRLMHEKYKIEGAVGSGQEVGNIRQGDLTQCPHYQRIHKAFRRLHMTVAIGNMTILLSTCLQLYFLASKIQIDVS